MRTFISLYFKLLCVLVTALIGLILIPVTLQVFARYTDFIPTWMWTEEAARFCLIWMIMIGAAIAVRTHGHFDIDILPEPKSKSGKILMRLLVEVITAVFGVIFLYVASEFAWEGRREISEITEMSMIIMYAAFPVSAFGWLLFLGEQIVDSVRELKEARP
ncbi:MAG: TRAP transporter small permease [Candidatus Accumulibacter sp.]|jgi:TRAP-type C4-dicarboxylate transport system permease small subunit|nr:TRAP transporter small permease [Accumulibacter sp.]